MHRRVLLRARRNKEVEVSIQPQAPLPPLQTRFPSSAVLVPSSVRQVQLVNTSLFFLGRDASLALGALGRAPAPMPS